MPLSVNSSASSDVGPQTNLIAAEPGICSAVFDIASGFTPLPQAALRPFGFSNDAHDIPLTFWADRIHPQDRHRAEWVLDSLLNARIPQAQIECRLRGDDEHWHWLALIGRIECNPDGEPVRLLICLRNTTMEHTAREQLHQFIRNAERERDADRTMLARELHDELGQWLTAIRMDADRILTLHRRGSAPSASELSDRLTEIKDIASDSIKAVQRICQELRSSIPMELGLVSAVRSAADSFEARTGIRCPVTLPETEPSLDPECCRALCRALHEALTNVIRHAHASEVRVTLRDECDAIELEIADNGRGLPPGVLNAPTSIGLFGLRERTKGVGGEATITTAADSGTVVTLRIPRQTAAEERQPVCA